jgi:uncharacterized protein (DUF2249 family)
VAQGPWRTLTKHPSLMKMRRAAKSGERWVVVNDHMQEGLSVQTLRPNRSQLEIFPQNFHEPYYAEYLNEKFAALAEESGLR